MRLLLLSRKGQTGEDDGTFPWLTAAAIAVVILLIVVLLYEGIFSGGKDAAAEARCRASIAAHSKVVSASVGQLSADIECTARTLTIDASNADKAKAQLATEMKSCWDRWQGGEQLLFTEKGTYCNPCAFVTIGKAPVTDFSAYLFQPVAGGQAYASYLYGDRSPAVMASPSQAAFTFQPGQQYAVLFYYTRTDAKRQLPEQFSAVSTVTCALFSLIQPGACEFLIPQGVDRVVDPATDKLRQNGYFIGAMAGKLFSTGVQGAATGTVTEPDWTSAVIVVPNDAGTLRSLHCQLVDQQGPQQTGPKDV